MSVRLPLTNIGSILGELKMSPWADNVTYRGRVLWKSISIQRDVGDLILHAEYRAKRTKMYSLSIADLEKMQRFERVGGTVFELYGVSKDFQHRTTSKCSSVEEVLGSPLIKNEEFIEFAKVPFIKSLLRNNVRLVSDVNNMWSFIQYPR